MGLSRIDYDTFFKSQTFLGNFDIHQISKDTFADELGTNLAEGKTWKLSKIFKPRMIKNLGSMFPGKV